MEKRESEHEVPKRRKGRKGGGLEQAKVSFVPFSAQRERNTHQTNPPNRGCENRKESSFWRGSRRGRGVGGT